MGLSLPGRRTIPAGPLAAALLALIALGPAAARAADVSLTSRTYLVYSESETAGGTDTYLPLYEYLSGDVRGVAGGAVSFHFYGWGRLDLMDDTGADGTSGDIGSAYVRYLHPKGNAEARLGRFFLAEGTASEILDGAFVKVRTPIGLGFSAFAGLPLEQTITTTQAGDSIYGGRVFLASGGFAEVGVSYLVEKGTFQGDDREVAGMDLWVRPGLPLELSGRASYNLATEGLADQRYVLRIYPFPRFDLAAGFEEYAYRDLFQTALNPAFLPPSAPADDEVQALFALLSYGITKGVAVEAELRQLDHKLDDPGDALRAGLGLRFSYNDGRDAAGLSAASVTGDRAENEYAEFRAFATWSPGNFRFSLDGLTHRYGQAIGGTDEAWHAVASAGWQLLDMLKVSGDVTYNRSPRFDEDVAGLVRVSLNLGTAPGGTK